MTQADTIQAVIAVVAVAALILSVRAEVRSARLDPRVRWTAEGHVDEYSQKIVLRNEGRKKAWDVSVDPYSVRSANVRHLPTGTIVHPGESTWFWLGSPHEVEKLEDTVRVVWRDHSRGAFPWNTPLHEARVSLREARAEILAAARERESEG